MRNEVVLWGRLSAPAERRELPSGDVIVTLRVVVERPTASSRSARSVPGSVRRRTTGGKVRPPGVDTIDVVCWSASTRRAALRLGGGEQIEVEGALRRRFFAGAAGRQSRYEVEAAQVRRRGGRRRKGTSTDT
ncbi:MAG: single-stranded DNA-binding protein [Humibacillus sp.]|nr:single-stranded DNA-binding protein [Humibacillus sp.]